MLNRLLINKKFLSYHLYQYFASQCTPLQNLSSLLTLRLRTDKKLSSLNISEDDIFAIIENLNYIKSHGWEDLSIKMIKPCGKSIAYPLKLIFESSLLGGEFTECWKRANVVSAHKKESKNLVKNNRPVSLLPMFRKIFERVIFKDLFNYFHKNELFTKCQSDFLPGDSCASHLTILHRMSGAYFGYFQSF